MPEPERIGGQRRYNEDAVRRLEGDRRGQARGVQPRRRAPAARRERRGEPAHAQIRELAERKLPEVDALIARAEAMREWLTRAQGCNCSSLEVCGLFDVAEATRYVPPMRLRVGRALDGETAGRCSRPTQRGLGYQAGEEGTGAPGTANEQAVASIVPLTAIAMSSGTPLPGPVSRPVTFTGGCCAASCTSRKRPGESS